MISASVVDIAVVVLLVATCGCCFLLHQRLKAVKNGQVQLTSAIAAFDEATRLAQANLARMEAEGRTSARDLSVVVGRANALARELSGMVGAGDRVASRIEGAVVEVRTLGRNAERAGALQ